MTVIARSLLDRSKQTAWLIHISHNLEWGMGGLICEMKTKTKHNFIREKMLQNILGCGIFRLRSFTFIKAFKCHLTHVIVQYPPSGRLG